MQMPNQGPGEPDKLSQMHKPRQAIPECNVKMYWIKEAAEAQILRQAELH